MSSNYNQAKGLLPSELMPVYKNHQALPIEGSKESLKELLDDYVYPNPYECNVYSGTAPYDGAEYYIPELGLAEGVLWHIKYFPGYTATGGSIMVAYAADSTHPAMQRVGTTSAWGEWFNMANAADYTHPSYAALTGVPTSDQSPAFGGSFNITQPVTDDTGHVTKLTSRKVTIPATTMGAATADADGKTGLVPAPGAGEQAKFLRGDGEWATPTPQSLGFGVAICDTEAATMAKVATLSGYNLVANGIVVVKFTYAVPASATLNINGKGAKAIYNRNAVIEDGVILAGDLVTFVYNGNNYHITTIDRISNTTSLMNNTTRGSLGWTSVTVANSQLVTANTIAFWDGRYNDNASNLAYCIKGAFGDIVTENKATFNAVSATNVKTSVVNPSTTTVYYPTFVDTNNSSATAEAVKTNAGIRNTVLIGTTSVEGTSAINLGNGKAKGTDGNQTGHLVLYGNNTGYTRLMAAGSTSNFNVYIPAEAGTLKIDRYKDYELLSPKAYNSDYSNWIGWGLPSNTATGNKYDICVVGEDEKLLYHGVLTLGSGTVDNTIVWDEEPNDFSLLSTYAQGMSWGLLFWKGPLTVTGPSVTLETGDIATLVIPSIKSMLDAVACWAKYKIYAKKI